MAWAKKSDQRAYSREYRAAHKEEIRETQRKYREKNRKRRLAQNREYYRKNREKVLQKMRARYKSPKVRKQRIENSYKWRERNVDKSRLSRREYMRKRREGNWLLTRCTLARHRYPGHLTIKDLEAVVERDGFECRLCGKKLDKRSLTFHHTRPINNPKYMVVACVPCNSRQGSVR